MGKTTFAVWSVGMKPRYYENLEDVIQDFSEDELDDAHISVLYRGVVVGEVNPGNLLYEIAIWEGDGNG